MRSILHQLQKYRPDTDVEAPKINVPETKEEKKWDKFHDLAARIVAPQYCGNHSGGFWESAVKRVANLLVDMPESKWTGKLFSEEILGIYHCYYNHQTQVAGEDTTDAFFMQFLRGVDLSEYQKQFEEAVDPETKKLAVVRIALATSEQNSLVVQWHANMTNSYGETYVHKKQDELPREFQEPAFEYLGIDSISAAANMQERLTRRASLDQVILGRMGYMMFWSWCQGGNRSNVPLLSAPRKAISPPAVICLPAPP